MIVRLLARSAFSGECEIIMKVLLQRLGATDAGWRHLYKVISWNWNTVGNLDCFLLTDCFLRLQTLAVIEYLLANGTQRSVGEIIDNSSGIAVCSIASF